MRKRTKKRFESISQINDEIDRYKRKAKKLQEAADALDIKADTIARSENAELNVELIAFTRLQASRHRRSVFNIENKKMAELKGKLAEFQTQILPGVVPDSSIQR